MKLKFIEKPKGRDFKVGQVVDFNEKDAVEMSYAEKYVARGWAEQVSGKPIEAAKPAEGQQAGQK